MSDASVNPSVESPASETAPLPIPPPATQTPVVSFELPHPGEVAIDVDEDLYHPVSPSPEPEEQPPPEVPFPISPRSALATLQAFGTGGSAENLRGVAQATARALLARTEEANQKIAAAHQRI